MIEAYPLQWPAGWPRTRHRQAARFSLTFADARGELLAEVARLGGTLPVLSSNVPLRRDGLPYAGQRDPEDPGVAVYFQLKRSPMVFACDRYVRVRDNIRAVGKTIEALRGIERWGASDMMERAFTGFQAIPHLDAEAWHSVLMLPADAPAEVVEAQYRKLRSDYHPDRPGGSAVQFDRIMQAYAQWQAAHPNGSR